MHELLTTQQAAVIAKVSDKTVLRWIQRGKMQADRIGRKQWIIQAGELHRFLKKRSK